MATKKKRDRILTIDDLATAIQIKASEGMSKKMSKDKAVDLAKTVFTFFGFQRRIIDNVLEPEERDVFYQLEDDYGFLNSYEDDDVTLYDGRPWRIFYWEIKINEIFFCFGTSIFVVVALFRTTFFGMVIL